jgi:hypothetical protein
MLAPQRKRDLEQVGLRKDELLACFLFAFLISGGHYIYEDPCLHSESVATLPPFGPIEGQKWFDQISSQ